MTVPGSARAARWACKSSSSATSISLRASSGDFFELGRRRLPRLARRPDLRHGRPRRARRHDRLDRTAFWARSKPAWEVCRSGKPRPGARPAGDCARAVPRRVRNVRGPMDGPDIDGIDLAIGGTSAPWGPAIDPLAVPPADLRILLSHSPDLCTRPGLGSRPDVLRAQPRWPDSPAVGRPGLHAQPLFETVRPGVLPTGRTLLYVNEGIAGKHPVRYGCPPEITGFRSRAARK